MIITQHLSSQVRDNSELNIDDAIIMQGEVLDSIRFLPQVATNSLVDSLKKESDVIKKYLMDLIDTAENGLDSLKYYTIDDAWYYKFRGTNLE